MTKKELNIILLINLGLILIPVNIYVFSKEFTLFHLIIGIMLNLIFYNSLWLNIKLFNKIVKF